MKTLQIKGEKKMFRTYIRFKYVYSPLYDSEYYKEAAYIINRDLMRKLDSESPKKANDNWGELCVCTKRQMTIEEMKVVIKYLWESVIEKATGSYNGFQYKDLRPNSFSVSIQEADDNQICQTAIDLCNISDNIIEFFAMQDLNRIYNIYDNRCFEIESKIKTIADCL